MRELTEWMGSTDFPDKPWLILGKGPTFDRRDRFDLDAFNRLSLNHSVTALPVDIAHVIDIDVIADCVATLATNARWVLMPRYPHVASAPSTRILEDYFDELPVLREVDEQGRLVWYNLVGARPEGGSPIIGAKHFSSEAALTILGRMGARVVRSLGVDGGRSYATTFSALDRTTLLANGKPLFDLQFERISIIADEYGIDYGPLVEPLRIFIGTDDSQVVAHHVLEYSIRKSASVPVEIIPMLESGQRKLSNGLATGTGFSLSRFAIPELAGYKGRALYLDADMLVFADIGELYDLPFGDHTVLTTSQDQPPAAWANDKTFRPGRQLSVMLLDCERLDWNLDKIVSDLEQGKYTYEQLVHGLCITDEAEVADDIPPEWNHLERYEPGVTKLLHYTVVKTQPWKTDSNELGELWMSAFRDAVEVGAVPPEDVEALVDAGLGKPSLTLALGLAPTRRTLLTNASRDLIETKFRLAQVEARMAEMQTSWSWRIGDAIVSKTRPLRTLARRLARRGR